MKIYQPQFDWKGNVIGHPDAECKFFWVWSTEEKLLEDFPDCTPAEYEEEAIQDYELIK